MRTGLQLPGYAKQLRAEATLAAAAVGAGGFRSGWEGVRPVLRQMCAALSGVLGHGTSTYLTRLVPPAATHQAQLAPKDRAPDLEFFVVCGRCEPDLRIEGARLPAPLGCVRQRVFRKRETVHVMDVAGTSRSPVKARVLGPGCLDACIRSSHL